MLIIFCFSFCFIDFLVFDIVTKKCGRHVSFWAHVKHLCAVYDALFNWLNFFKPNKFGQIPNTDVSVLWRLLIKIFISFLPGTFGC